MMKFLQAFLFGVVCLDLTIEFTTEKTVDVLGLCASVLLICVNIRMMHSDWVSYRAEKRDGFECPYEKEKQDSKGE